MRFCAINASHLKKYLLYACFHVVMFALFYFYFFLRLTVRLKVCLVSTEYSPPIDGAGIQS